MPKFNPAKVAIILAFALLGGLLMGLESLTGFLSWSTQTSNSWSPWIMVCLAAGFGSYLALQFTRGHSTVFRAAVSLATAVVLGTTSYISHSLGVGDYIGSLSCSGAFLAGFGLFGVSIFVGMLANK